VENTTSGNKEINFSFVDSGSFIKYINWPTSMFLGYKDNI